MGSGQKVNLNNGDEVPFYNICAKCKESVIVYEPCANKKRDASSFPRWGKKKELIPSKWLGKRESNRSRWGGKFEKREAKSSV